MCKIKSILIVEDEAVNALALKLMLTTAGYNVIGSVAKGEKAVDEALKKIPDLILMDIRLAGEIDGIEAAKRIRGQKYIPVIFMTGYAEASVEERASALHPEGFLTKPVSYSEIEKRIGVLNSES